MHLYLYNSFGSKNVAAGHYFLPQNEAGFAVTAITETQTPWGAAK